MGSHHDPLPAIDPLRAGSSAGLLVLLGLLLAPEPYAGGQANDRRIP